MLVPPEHRVLVDPSETVDPFYIRELQATAPEPSRAKGKYAAQLHASVECNVPGFKVRGKWFQVLEDESLSGLLTIRFGDDDNDGIAETPRSKLVYPGIYRFYVKNIYHPEYSYDPIQNTGSNWPDEEPYVEVIVN